MSPRVQEKPQRSPERIQKKRGAQNGTPKKRKNRRDAKRKNPMWCPVRPDLSLLKEKETRKGKETTKTSSTQTLRQENEPKKTRPDMKRFFQGTSGANLQETTQKTEANPHQKHKATKKRKTKVRARKCFAQTDPKKRAQPKNGIGQEPDHKKTQVKKNGHSKKGEGKPTIV